jgi:hypothetical protein
MSLLPGRNQTKDKPTKSKSENDKNDGENLK